MTPHDEHFDDRQLPRLSPEDAEIIERLIAGEHVGDAPAERVERARQLHALLQRWEAPDADAALSSQTLARILRSAPVSISPEDGLALDALLALRQQGLSTGPMPAGSQARAEGVTRVLSVLDRAGDELIPEGLVARTMQAVERDRTAHRRFSAASTVFASGSGRGLAGGINIRQIATTAALLLLVLSVLLPILDKGKRDAKIALCGQNLAGLGAGLYDYSADNKGVTQPESPAMFGPLSTFASKDLDGSTVPASRVNLFILLDEKRVEASDLQCPSAEPGSDTAYYNGQNPLAGGPLRVFLQPRPVFADTNPLYRVTPTGLIRDVTIPGLTQSKNHDGVGQNVLISDGTVQWMSRPAVLRSDRQEDNIWLYQPPAKDAREADVFLTP